MALFGAVDDRWGGRSGPLSLVLRLVGMAFFTYLLVGVGAFSGAVWTAVLSGLCVVFAFTLMLLRVFRRFDRLGLVVCVAMMLAGAVVNPSIQNLGTVFFVIGGIILVGQPELSLRVGTTISVIVGLVISVQPLVHGRHLSWVLSDALATVAVVLSGYSRRQRVIRLGRERELAARSAELEERNAELLAQTEQTRRETARVAALQERSRIARDLHDLLAHSLGGLVVQLEAAGAELEGGHTVQAAARLRSSRQLAVDGLREARAAVQELRGEDPETGGGPDTDLAATLASVLRGPVGLQLGAELEVVGEQHPVPAALAQVFTAVSREALTNVNKHAPGGTVSLTLVFAAHRLRLEVVNGLAPAAAGSLGRNELARSGLGAGLTGLRERLVTVGGTLCAGPEGRRWVLAAECPDPVPQAAQPEADPSRTAAGQEVS